MLELIIGASIAAAGLANHHREAEPTVAYLDRLPQEEVVYFVLPDRFENGDRSNDTGGLSGGPLDHGFDPTHKGFYNGGDLKGLTERLDYLQNMGITAIWFAPIFKNKPVQGPPGPRKCGLSRLLGDGLYLDRPPFRDQCRIQGLRRCGPCAGHEGLYGHHHQPYGRCHQI